MNENHEVCGQRKNKGMKSCEDILSKTLYGLCVQVGVLFGWFLNCMVNVFLKMYHMAWEIMGEEERDGKPVGKFLD